MLYVIHTLDVNQYLFSDKNNNEIFFPQKSFFRMPLQNVPVRFSVNSISTVMANLTRTNSLKDAWMIQTLWVCWIQVDWRLEKKEFKTFMNIDWRGSLKPSWISYQSHSSCKTWNVYEGENQERKKLLLLISR